MLELASAMCFIVMFFAGSNSFAQIIAIGIQVSPSTLNLKNQGTWVTFHTDIEYSAVAGASVTLNDVEIDWWKSDNQCNFVARFVIQDIKDLLLNISDYNTLTLCGETNDGVAFSGSVDVMVIDVNGKK